VRDVLADQGVTPEAEALHLEAYARVITKDHLIAFAAGAALCFLLTWFIDKPKYNSERLLRLQRDSMEYADGVRRRDSLYMDLWIQYAHKDDSLTLALDDLATARRRRPPSRIADNDSLRAAILRELYQR
jgi:hypothetical protein